MLYLLLGIAVLLFLIFAGRYLVASDPKKLAATLRKIGGWAMIGLAGLFMLRGLVVFAVPLALAGMGLLGIRLPSLRGFPGGFGPFSGHAEKSAGQQSKVRTPYVEMSLDHDTGEMDGIVVKGRHAGDALSELDIEILMDLAAEYRSSDPQSAQLLEAYLDRRDPGWRAGAQSETAGGGGSGFQEDQSSIMGEEEAYEVLGVEQGASQDEVRRAHRELMKRLHPDQGGSTYLAAKINQAKDVLLK